MSIFWYHLKITLFFPEKVSTIRPEEDVVFNGYFAVDNDSALVVAVHESVGGTLDPNKNLLIPTGSVGVVWDDYFGFTVYRDPTFARYNNAYINGWPQFDYYGIILNGMSMYPQFNRFNLCAVNIGEEATNQIGLIIITDHQNNHIPIPATFDIVELTTYSPLKIETPPFRVDTGFSTWYNLSVTLPNGKPMFKGYFWVNAMNRVEALFETVNGATNFRNNLMVWEAPGSKWWGKTEEGFNIMRQAILYRYTNMYISNWKQFDGYGVIFRGMSAFPQYDKFNFYAIDFGQENFTNYGELMITDPNTLVDGKVKRIFIQCFFNISKTSNPTYPLLVINNKRGKMPNQPNSHVKRVKTSMCGQSSFCNSYENYLMGLKHA